MIGALDEMTARGRFQHYFGKKKHVFLVAIHVTQKADVWMGDIDIANQEGADGIIVIRHRTGTNEDVLAAYEWACKHYDDWWIGVNFLGYSPLEAVLKAPKGVSGVWFDDSCIDENDPNSTKYLSDVELKSDILHLPKPPLIMPSIAMKYQPFVHDLFKVAKMAEPYAHILVTSGERTGRPPTVDKMRTIRRAVDVPIAIASGIDANNVGSFLDVGVEVFIVNSSLNVGHPGDEHLDAAKVGHQRAAIPSD